jgi:hypothetical protein
MANMPLTYLMLLQVSTPLRLAMTRVIMMFFVKVPRVVGTTVLRRKPFWRISGNTTDIDFDLRY